MPDPREPIEVALVDGAPAQFLLRGRLHVVRAVLARWTEPGGWRWSGPGRVAAVPAAVGAAAGDRPAVPFIPSVPVDLADRDVWRVEAAAGRSDRPRVFDLCRETGRVSQSSGGAPTIERHALEPERTRWTATQVEE